MAARVAWDWSRYVGKLQADPGAAKHYLFNGAAPKEGDVIRFPALAATLKTIAAKGARAFYEGEIADDMAATVAARGSFLTPEDFARHRGDAVTPISSNYRGLDLIEMPPNGQGLTALVMLNILENFDLAALDPLGPERFHLVLEAARLGFAVRDTHLADAAHMRIAVADLLDKGFAKKLAAKIDLKKRVKLPSAPTPGSDTVYLTRGRPRPHGGVVHQHAVFAFRLRHLHREDRHPADQSRRLLHAGGRSSQHIRPGQAADAHHHSGAWPCAAAAAT